MNEPFKIKRSDRDLNEVRCSLPVDQIKRLGDLAFMNNISFDYAVAQCIDYALEHLDANKER